MKSISFVAATILVTSLMQTSGYAQRGIGEQTGMAQRAVKPAIMTMEGVVKDTKVGPCKQTTGRSAEGAHLIIQSGETTINLHLGPSAAVGDLLKAAPVGQQVSFEGFRTDRMPAQSYIARKVNAAGQTFTLRDEDLRPSWAGQGRGQGRGLGGGWRRGYGGCW